MRQPCKEEVNVTTVVAKHDELHVTVSYSQLYEFPDIFVTPPQFRQCLAIFQSPKVRSVTRHRLVGCFNVVFVYVASAIFQPYCDMEAGDNQSLKP